MSQGIIGAMLLMGLVGLEVCQWRIGVPLVIVWVLLMGLGGLLWAMLDFFGDDHHAEDKRQESASPDPHDREEPHDCSSRQPKADVAYLQSIEKPERERPAGREDRHAAQRLWPTGRMASQIFMNNPISSIDEERHQP